MDRKYLFIYKFEFQELKNNINQQVNPIKI